MKSIAADTVKTVGVNWTRCQALVSVQPSPLLLSVTPRSSHLVLPAWYLVFKSFEMGILCMVRLLP